MLRELIQKGIIGHFHEVAEFDVKVREVAVDVDTTLLTEAVGAEEANNRGDLHFALFVVATFFVSKLFVDVFGGFGVVFVLGEVEII